MLAGCAGLLILQPHTAFWEIAVQQVLLAGGLGLIVPAMTNALLGSVDRSRSGIASGTLIRPARRGSVLRCGHLRVSPRGAGPLHDRFPRHVGHFNWTGTRRHGAHLADPPARSGLLRRSGPVEVTGLGRVVVQWDVMSHSPATSEPGHRRATGCIAISPPCETHRMPCSTSTG